MLQYALNQLVGTAPFSAGSKMIVFQETQQFLFSVQKCVGFILALFMLFSS